MADTLLRAAYERYNAGRLANPSWPAAFSAVQPEGTARAFPNLLLEQPEDERYQLEQGGDTPLCIASAYGPLRLTAWAVSLEAASELMLAVRAWMEAERLTVGSDLRVALERYGYREAATGTRGPAGDFVFMARLTYRAMWNPTAD